ncbi:non-canonical purine NTP diphosphatase [Allomuricauda sp. SCSIO 65647]|uniref:non-canonical purine NTP diphosphatase n=1 Tax=Allomuricauda sp. SCSIO 65647 TaxID=2908843 RepID=UPI001F16749E|nr:non-canonical purine NTP diphosphatase [Muricauda sp. SCSIO 65647]UJH67655.1 non-canonical purine NTP diphosphatase [Muricauda sp. SCSIO 65647]
MKLVFATHNQNKFKEVAVLMPKNIELLSLNSIGCRTEIPETGATLQENARIKADFVTQKYQLNCFADDTGLLVEGLDGRPGVYSARYAGEHKSAIDNMQKVLTELQGAENRKAYFETVIALNINGEQFMFSGRVDGKIIENPRGEKGFGYDPIFIPEGYDKTFAELSLETKNKISHRGQAIQHLIQFLKKNS